MPVSYGTCKVLGSLKKMHKQKTVFATKLVCRLCYWNKPMLGFWAPEQMNPCTRIFGVFMFCCTTWNTSVITVKQQLAWQLRESGKEIMSVLTLPLIVSYLTKKSRGLIFSWSLEVIYIKKTPLVMLVLELGHWIRW